MQKDTDNTINFENKEKAIILLSGGMDSALTLAFAIEMGYIPCALHINYNQKTMIKEKWCYEQLCDFYKITDKLEVDISYLAKIGGSSLTDQSIEVSKADLESHEVPSSYVPFRNANILAIATSWAEILGAKALFIGAVEEDSSGYPDTRKSFFEAFEKVIDTGTKPETKIRIITPVIDMSKRQIVQEGKKLNVPFDLTWSCYKSEDKACGECDSCALRLRGFAQANVNDPIEYK